MQNLNYCAISGWILINLHFPRLDKFQNCLHCLCGRRITSPFPTDITSQAYHYFHGKCSSELHSLVPPAQIFTVKTYLVTSTGLNPPHSLLIPLVRRKFPTDSHFQNQYFAKQTPTWVLP